MRINIQESLKERDVITENKYNLYSNYCSHTYTTEQKKNIAEAIYKGATDVELLEILDDSEVEYREVKEYAKANSNRRFIDEDGNIFSIWDLLNDFIDWELDDKVEEEPDKSVKQLFIDYIRNSTDKSGTLEEIRENLEEASYGGAFDIEDDQYFTRDDLVEFAEEVMYVLHTNAKGPLDTPEYTNLYVDGNQIYITVMDEDGNEFTDKISVDFRKIKRLSDLISKYTLPLAERIIAQAEDAYRDMNEGCSKKKKKLEEDLENSEGKEIPSAPKGDNTGIANLINALIKDEWDAIDGYQTAIATLRSLDGDNGDAILVFQEIANDEYSHIGNLQKILDKFAPQVSTIANGAKEAEETIAMNT